MGIYKIIEKAIEGMNRAQASRFDAYRKNMAYEAAIDDFINDRYDNFKKERAKNNFFEAFQRIQDDLRMLVVRDETLVINNALKTVTLPDDYRHELGFELFINGLWKSADATTFNELQAINENYHTRATPEKPKYFQYQNVIEFTTGGVAVPTKCRLTYLKNPIDAYVQDDLANLIVAGASVLTIGSLYTVPIRSASVTVNGVTYVQGQTFTATSTTMTGSGSVALTVETEFPHHTHVEISRIMTRKLTSDVENYQKFGVKQSEIQNQ